MTDEDIETLLDGQDPVTVAVLLEGTAQWRNALAGKRAVARDDDTASAVLLRLAQQFRAYATRTKPATEAD